MADRSVKPGDPETPRDIVELDKDDRWQARLAEARARREVALAEKAAGNTPKRRLKPWEEEPGQDPDEVKIEPMIQERPPGDDRLDFADRLEVMREGDDDSAEPKPSAEKPTPVQVKPFDEIIPPEPDPEPEAVPAPAPRTRAPTVTPSGVKAPPPVRKTRADAEIVAPDAPDVIDLAQRYASTLKPPVNVTKPFDTVPPPEPQDPFVPIVDPQPSPQPMPLSLARRSRRPFGLSIFVLAFSLLPLAETAPPLEKGPASRSVSASP